MKKITALLTLCAIFLSIAGVAGEPAEIKAADPAETIASLNYAMTNSHTDAEADGTLSKTKFGSKKTGYKFTAGDATLFASINGSGLRKLEWSKDQYKDTFSGGNLSRQPVMTAGKKNPWKAGSTPYFEVRLSTTGYRNISFSSYIGATKKGPKSYRVSYAVGDGGAFAPVSGAALDLSDNKVMTRVSAALPAQANNQKIVRVRIEVTSLTSIGGTNMADVSNSTGGEVSINHIIISGSKALTANASSSVNQAGGSGGTTAAAGMKVKKITLNKKKVSLRKKKKCQLKVKVKVSPQTKANEKAVMSKVKWTSSNKKVAAVTKNGKVKAKKKGKATITVKYSKKIKATCKVTVK